MQTVRIFRIKAISFVRQIRLFAVLIIVRILPGILAFDLGGDREKESLECTNVKGDHSIGSVPKVIMNAIVR